MTKEAHEQSDVELIEAVLAGNVESFAWIARRHVPPVFLSLRLRGIPERDAEEITSETLLHAYTELSGMRAPGQLASRLLAMTEDEVISFSRRRRPTTAYLHNRNKQTPTPEDRALEVWQHAARLPEDYRAVFFHIHTRRIDCRHIAAESRLSLGAVRSRLEHAYELLVSTLSPGLKDPECRRHVVHAWLLAGGETDDAGAPDDHESGCPDCAAAAAERARVVECLVGPAAIGASTPAGLSDSITSAAAELPRPRSESQWPSRLLWIAILGTALALGFAIWGVLLSAV